MTTDTHLLSLKTKHTALEKEILAEEGRPNPDSSKIQSLKRLKLKLKEEIETTSSGMPKLKKA